MTATKFISAAALSTLLAGVSGVQSTNSAVGSVANRYFGVGNITPKKGWNLDITELRGGSTVAEEVPKKKKSKKKTSNKKKLIKPDVTSKAATKAAVSNAGAGDLSEAILNSSKSKNTMKVYQYSEEDSGHSVVGMTENAMTSLGVFDGDTVLIKGKRGKKNGCNSCYGIRF